MTITGPIETQADYRRLLEAINHAKADPDERKRLVGLAKDFTTAQRATGRNPAMWNRKEFGL